MTNILVTGASGFVGGAFMRRFGQRDDLCLHGVARRYMPWPNYTQLDLSHDIRLDFRPDVVIHAAAHVSPWGTAAQYQQQNINATENVIRFCQQHGLPKLVYLSSSSVFYRDEPQFNLTEDSAIGPEFINAYSASKYAAELCIKRYEGSSVILRPRAIFGPGDTVLFPRILAAAKKGRLPLFDSSGPAAIGDLIYIDTLCDYILSAALRPDITGAYNLTNAEPVEFQSLLLTVLHRLGMPAPKRRINVNTAMRLAAVLEWLYHTLRIKKEPPLTRYGVSVLTHSKTFDVSRMLADFGPPSVSVAEGIEHFIRWQLQHG
ncbi:NAD-dependent epimerase/dehydratase family protein [Rheinheimera hassiensis]|uniref:NAD-dependent epimerase/dehydratase family protein n=1 Tax=Rheinheimera hassiensis TaxID=1193627 RepID=UPI001F05C26F|nr:NAD(P)-dependent oxidoreductase [Rheinheimera hassiensis]